MMPTFNSKKYKNKNNFQNVRNLDIDPLYISVCLKINKIKSNFLGVLAWAIPTIFWIKARISYYTNNWIYTTNHKRIAVNYFWFVILSGIVGMVLATIIRLEFAYPGVGVLAGDSIQYLSLASAHGVIMVFFMIMPLLFGAFANFLLPTQLGVHDVAFPRLNSAAFWFLPGGLLMLCQLVCIDRRYQRMNCFNIREVESLLKRKFFTDLINSKDHHVLLNNTAVGLRYKLNNINSSNNTELLYNYGLVFTPQSRTELFSYFYTKNNLSVLNNTQIFTANSYMFKLISYFNVNNVFFLLNFFFFFFLEKSFLMINNLNFFNEFSLVTFALEKIWNTFQDFIFSTISFFYNFFSFLSLIGLFIPFSIVDFLIRAVIGSILYFYSNLIQVIVYNLYLLFKNLWLRFKTLEIYKTLNYDNLKFFFYNTNKNIFDKNFLYFYFNSLMDYLKFFLKHISNESTFDWTVYRFVINYNFKDNYFLCNVYNIFKILLNNWFACFSWKNMVYRFEVFAQREVEYPSYENIKSQPISYRNLWNNTLADTYWNSFLLEFYTLIFFFFSIPLTIVNLFLYLCTSHFIHFDFKKMKSDFIFWYYNTLNGSDIWRFTPSEKEIDSIHKTHNQIYASTSSFFNKYQLMFLKISNLFKDLTLNFFNFFHYFKRFSIFLIVEIYAFLLNFWIGYYFLLKRTYSSSSLKKNLSELSDILSSFFSKINRLKTFKFNFIKKNTDSSKYLSNQKNTTNSKENFLFNNEELSNNSRFVRFNLPIFKYDYKSGDYFPKLYKDAYSFLIPSFLDLTSGLRTPSWFFSSILNELLESTLYSTLINLEKKFNFGKFNILSTQNNKISHSDAFYNFFFILNDTNSDLNLKWISTNSLNVKFNRMFLTSSLQQRLYNNWRTLKFTREAWRCKMLLSRHQKTLFRRYMHEDGVFWSIERNAKDLIPGWAMITPFSSRTRYTAVGKTDIGLMGVLLVLNSSIISGANFLVTYRYLSTLNNRKMRDARAFFTEAVMVASWMMILANPMLVIGIIMLISDRHWQTSFFDYSGGGDTVLFQHMFWFFGHPEVYVIIIPTFGFTNTMVSYYLKKRVSARASLLYSLYTIAFLGFFVWGHHMYMVGLSHTTRMLFSTLTVMISVPAATKIMHWCVTTANSAFAMELPLLCTFTFIFFFVSGGISGMCVAHTGMDVLFHDTFYVIGHFHVMLASGAMFACFGAFYFYFPAIFGVKYSRVYAYLHYVYYLIGQLMTVIPMFWLGYAGMPRRVLDYPAAFGGWHSVISAGHMLNVAGLMAFFIMIFDSLRQAKAATRNTFGINRYNTRLNFYLYEISRLTYVQQKSLFLFKLIKPFTLRLNNFNYTNFEPYESVLFSYTLTKK